MEVRRARPADASAVARVHVETWQAAYVDVFGAERLAGIDTPGRERQALRLIESAEADVFVAVEDEGRIVGFAASGAAEDAPATRELHAIYVLPEAWGTGAGAGLLAASVAAMRARDATDAVLSVLEDNPRARRFYEREGWRLDGTGEASFLGVTVPIARYRLILLALPEP